MKPVKRGVAKSSVKKTEKLPEVSEDDVMPLRVLRSHKRKLTEIQRFDEAKRTKKSNLEDSTSTDGPDCIVLNEIAAPNSSISETESGCRLTSTPYKESCSKEPRFEESCIKTVDDKPISHKNINNVKENTNEIIVLSDSSASTLQVIVLSDDEQGNTDTEIEVLSPTATKKVKTPTNSPRASRSRSSNRDSLKCLNGKAPPVTLPIPQLIVSKEFVLNKKRKTGHKHRRLRERKPCARPVSQEVKTNSQPQIGENIYFDSPIVLPKVGLRPIIIDGSNVAFHHSNNCYFSCKGLDICIKYFKKRGHEVTAFVPHFRVQHNKSDNPKLLDEMVKRGDVVLTPSRTVDGNRIVSYDDRFIVQTAALKGGIIVTRDNYRDLLAENPAWADTIKYRLLQFTWVQDLLIFPKDPLGDRGPMLEEFLRFG